MKGKCPMYPTYENAMNHRKQSTYFLKFFQAFVLKTSESESESDPGSDQKVGLIKRQPDEYEQIYMRTKRH